MRRPPRRTTHTNITLVTGPPCSGKTTYVQQHMQPGDLVIDYDALAVALGSPDTHDHPKQLVPYIMQARDAVIDRIQRDRTLKQAWLIRTRPRPSDLAIATEHIALDTPREECLRRAIAAGRPTATITLLSHP